MNRVFKDACISWEQTVPVLDRLREAVRGRRENVRRKAMGLDTPVVPIKPTNGVKATNGAVGYVDLSDAKASGLHYASIKNQSGAFVAPTADALAEVSAFLAAHNLTATPFTPAGDVLTVQMTAAQANALFGASYDVFVDETDGKETVRTLEYALPAALKGHVEFVHPTVA